MTNQFEALDDVGIEQYAKAAAECPEAKLTARQMVAELSSECARLRFQTYRLVEALRPLAEVSIEKKAHYTSDMLVYLAESDIDHAAALVDDIAASDFSNQRCIVDELLDIARGLLGADGDRDGGEGSALYVHDTCAIAERLKHLARTLGHVEDAR